MAFAGYLNPAQRSLIALRGRTMRYMGSAQATLRKHEQVVSTVVNTAEVGAAAFLCGVAQGKWPGTGVWGVPVDLVAGLGLHVLAFAGIGGKYSSHLHAFGDGALASYLVTLGRDVGSKMSGMAGVDGVGLSGGASLADEELARMVRAGR